MYHWVNCEDINESTDLHVPCKHDFDEFVKMNMLEPWLISDIILTQRLGVL